MHLEALNPGIPILKAVTGCHLSHVPVGQVHQASKQQALLTDLGHISCFFLSLLVLLVSSCGNSLQACSQEIHTLHIPLAGKIKQPGSVH